MVSFIATSLQRLKAHSSKSRIACIVCMSIQQRQQHKNFDFTTSNVTSSKIKAAKLYQA